MTDDRRFCTPQTRAAPVKPGSFDAEKRTVDITFSTGADVLRFDYRRGKHYIERLLMGPENVRLGRLNNGAPVLAAHSPIQDSFFVPAKGRDLLRDVLGKVVEGSAVLVEGRGDCTVLFSARADVKDIVQDTQDGILQHYSVGYNIHGVRRTENEEGPDLVEITDWEPCEVSPVPMGADDGAKTRAAQPTPPVHEGDRPMATKTTLTPDEQAAKAERIKKQKADREAERTQAALDAAKVQRERTAGVLLTCDKLPLNPADAEVRAIIARDCPLDEARAALIDLHAARADKTPPTSSGHRVEGGNLDELTTRGAALMDYLCHRANPQKYPLKDAARQYVGMSSLEVAKDCLEGAGRRVRGLAREDVAGEALRMRSARDIDMYKVRMGENPGLTTSDFPLILAATTGKLLRDGYKETEGIFKQFCKRRTAKDFKPQRELILSSIGSLGKLAEDGQYRRTTLKEGQELWSVATYGEILAITRNILINDDLGAFLEAPALLGQAAARLESDLMIALITDNPLLSDGLAVFSAGHANLLGVGAGAPPGVDEIGLLRKLMRAQVDQQGHHIESRPRFVVGPIAMETQFEKLMATLFPAQAGNVVPESIRTLAYLTDPRFDDVSTKEWYTFGDPSKGQGGLVYGYLEGSEGAVTEVRNGFDVDGVEMKIRHDFGGGWADHRYSAKDAGE